MKKKTIIALLIILFLLLVVFLLFKEKKKSTKQKETLNTSIEKYDSEEDISWENYTEEKIELKENLKITQGGIYKLEGTLTNGSITINTKDNVKLILNGVSITNEKGPAIYIENAKTTVITLADETKNYLKDGSTYQGIEEGINAVIYSKDDLVLEGSGSLEIQAKKEDGIVSKDHLKIKGGSYNITSIDDGLRAKDSLYIQDGIFTMHVGGDGLKATNDTEESKGYIWIEKGTFTIESSLDGIQAETKLIIENGDFTITTGGGSTNASTKESWGNWGRGQYEKTQKQEAEASAKGVKAGDDLLIQGGTFTLNTSDDSIHSNSSIQIENGTFHLSSGDDGIHADKELWIEKGTIEIEESYEGIEAAKITIEDGNISIKASDDGINVAGGSDSSSMGRPGENNYDKNTENILTIQGGKIFVDADGDGIDVNGSGYIYGGTIIVEGPTDNGNGALDYDREFIVDGGTLTATGSSGMLQGVSSSKQYNVTIRFNSNYTKGTLIEIINGEETILSVTPSKDFSSLVFSSFSLQKGETYTIKIDGEVYQDFKLEQMTTSIGQSTFDDRNRRPRGDIPNNREPRR